MFVQRPIDYFARTPEGQLVLDNFAEVQQEWHLWKRRYNLFLRYVYSSSLSTMLSEQSTHWVVSYRFLDRTTPPAIVSNRTTSPLMHNWQYGSPSPDCCANHSLLNPLTTSLLPPFGVFQSCMNPCYHHDSYAHHGFCSTRTWQPFFPHSCIFLLTYVSPNLCSASSFLGF